MSNEVNVAWRLENQDGRTLLLNAIEVATRDCIRKAQPSAETLAKATKMTVVQIQLHEHESPSAEVTSPSGNPDLDSLVLGCLKHLPPNLVIPIRLSFLIPFSWKAEPEGNAASDAAAKPK